jgi:predicted Fe-Mo cluster-binding NifX family protein
LKIICLPIDENRGLLSRVAPRFCDAGSFLLVETGALAFRAIPNAREGACDPRVLLRGAAVDVFIVSDAGADGLREVPPLDAPVYRTPPGTVAAAIAAFIAGRLSPAPHVGAAARA